MPELQEREIRDLTSRSVIVRAETVNEEQRSVEAILNTEKRVEVFDWRTWDFIDEILLAEGMRVNGDQVVMLDSHRRDGTENVIGSIRNIRTENGQNIGTLFFAADDPNAERVWNLVRQKHITDVSVGYRVEESVDLKEGTSIEINGRTFTNDSNRVLRISTVWSLKEVSPVPIGANEEAKIRNEIRPETIKKEDKLKQEVRNMPEDKVTTPPVDVAEIERKAREEAAKKRGAEINEIYALAAQWNLRELADEAIKNGKSLDEFRKMVLDAKFEEAQVIDTQRDNIGLSEKETQEYSLGRAIRAIITGRRQDAGLEFEVTRELAKKMNMDIDSNRILVPNEVMHRMNHVDPKFAEHWMGKRAMTTSSGGTGLVGTDQLSASFIDMLRNRTALLRLGARMLTGLKGNISIPKQTGASTFQWVTEGGSVTEGDPTYGSVTASPKTGRGKVAFSRELLLQSNPSIDGLVFDDLSQVTAIGFDLGGISGDGTGGAPTGILNTSGIGDVTGTSLGWSGLVEFETDVRSANGDVGTMAYLTNAAVNGLLKTREKASGYPVYLIEDGMANGYPVEVSNQVPASTMIFGVFSQLILALWGVLAIEVDIYTDADNGNIVIRSFQSGDWIVRQAAAFSASDEIS